jgi:Uma2 family endonuclease
MTIAVDDILISQTLLDDLAHVSRKFGHLRKWTSEAYFALDGNYLVELADGRLEVLPVPTVTHQRVLRRLFVALQGWAATNGGEVLFAGTRVKTGDERYREPDLLYIPPDCSHLVHEQFVEKIGLAIEVVSESNRRHDLETKRTEYAEAGIPEYWIVDPEAEQVIVLRLEERQYVVHGEFGPGDRATSALLPSFNVDVTEVFAGV